MKAISLHLVLLLVIIGNSGCARSSPATAPRVTRAVAPAYPDIALEARSEFAVTIEVAINQSGDVADAKAVEASGPPKVYRKEWYEQLARQWQFAGSDLASVRTARIKFTFRLMPKETPPEQLCTVFLPPYDVEVRAKRPEDVHLFDKHESK